jgi:hypothetical protein
MRTPGSECKFSGNDQKEREGDRDACVWRAFERRRKNEKVKGCACESKVEGVKGLVSESKAEDERMRVWVKRKKETNIANDHGDVQLHESTHDGVGANYC